MSDQSKVLTVTFGTFSCTLQGFDDPFPVLRQIADYFQDLAAKDPMFGTRIGTVSADTLAMIANMTGGMAETMTGSDISVRAADKVTDQIASQVVEEIAVEEPAAPEVVGNEIAPTEDEVQEDEVAATPDELQSKTVEVVARSSTSRAALAAKAAMMNGLSASADQTEMASSSSDEETQAQDIEGDGDHQEDIADAETAEQDISDGDIQSAITSAFESDAQDAEAEAAPAPLLLDPAMQAPADDITADDSSVFAKDQSDASTQDDSDGLPEWASDLVADTDIAPAPTPVVQDLEPVKTPSPAATMQPGQNDSGYGMSTVRLSFGDEPGINQTREVVPTPAPTELPQTRFDAMEDTDAPKSDSEPRGFSEAAAPAPIPPLPTTPEPILDQTESEDAAPLVLTDAMSVEQTGTARADVSPVEHTSENSAETDAPGPVLRLVEPVTAQEAIDDGGTGTLREFAENAGAATLPDLLEASAAFVTLVNGRPSFTRGEIMRMVDTFSEDGAFSQEARIKSFGALIRGGRIHRTDTGDFEISRAARAAYENGSASG